MIGTRALAAAILISFTGGALFAAEPSRTSDAVGTAAVATAGIALEGKLKQPQSFDLAALRRLPAKQVEVSFQTDRGTTTTTRLWSVLMAAGGIADDAKGAELRHVIKITGRDGYMVVLSTGDIAPDYGGKPALIAYQRNHEPLGETGPRLVMLGDKRGSRNVRDVVAIRVE